MQSVVLPLNFKSQGLVVDGVGQHSAVGDSSGCVEQVEGTVVVGDW